MGLPRRKRIFQIIGVLFVIGALAGAYVWFFIVNKPHKDVAGSKPDFTYATTLKLYNEFSDLSKEEEQIEKFADKRVEVKGVIDKITRNADNTTILLGIEGYETDNISCGFDPEYNDRLEGLKEGDNVTIRGLFTGVNRIEDDFMGISSVDILLARCVVVTE